MNLKECPNKIIEEETKNQLTDLERALIKEFVKQDFHYLARDTTTSDLYLYRYEPAFNNDGDWYGCLADLGEEMYFCAPLINYTPFEKILPGTILKLD